MPTFAILTVLDAVDPDEAWSSLAMVLRCSAAGGRVRYIGAPWEVPPIPRTAELGTNVIKLWIDGESVALEPAK